MTTAPVEWMVEGYLTALERLLEAIRRGDAGDKETFLPLFDALNWAASIDKFFVDNGRPIQDDLLTGVRFARNRVHHQWGLALRRYDSPGVPMVHLTTGSSRLIGPQPGFWWYWVEVNQLPPGNPWPDGENAYAARLAGKEADTTLKALRPIFERLI
jgi:hypothetical protein